MGQVAVGAARRFVWRAAARCKQKENERFCECAKRNLKRFEQMCFILHTSCILNDHTKGKSNNGIRSIQIKKGSICIPHSIPNYLKGILNVLRTALKCDFDGSVKPGSYGGL